MRHHICRKLIVPEISADLLQEFTRFAQFAALAACDQNINATGKRLTCDHPLCGLVDADKTKIIDILQNPTSPKGYIALDHTKKLIVLAFRTSVSQQDSDVDSNKEPMKMEDLCPGCWVHSGFWYYWTSAKDHVISQLQTAIESHPDYSLAVVGHSLGGALATLAGIDLRQKGFILDIVRMLMHSGGNIADLSQWTFGSPKVGNYKLAEFITNQRSPVSVYRATHYTDIVPKQPSDTGYSQPSPEYWIDLPSNETVTTSDVKYIQGINSLKGNGGHNGTDQMPDPNHEWYFGNMRVCIDPVDLISIGEMEV
jgi:hypothetical protein